MEFDDFAQAQSLELLRLAYLLAGSRSDAEDLTQDTLLQLYRKWRTVAAARNPEAYARRVMTNLYLSAKRHKTFRLARIPANVEPVAAPDVAAGIANQDAVRTALGLLAPRQRTAVVLRYYSDLDDNEISMCMGLAPSSVRSAIARAHSVLREHLKEEGIPR